MLKQSLKYGSLAVLCLLAVGCYRAPVMPPTGLIYADVSAPMDIDTEDKPVGPKQGWAEAKSILGLVAWGDCSVERAVFIGQIQKVNHIDYKFYNVLGIYQKFTTVVYGE